MEADDQFAHFRSAAVPFYGSRMLHGGQSAAVTHSGLDADGWANTIDLRFTLRGAESVRSELQKEVTELKRLEKKIQATLEGQ
jgi:hypothetical protein